MKEQKNIDRNWCRRSRQH